MRPPLLARAVLVSLLAAAGLFAQASGPEGQTESPNLRIIVVSTSGEAVAVLDRLKRGENFAGVARSTSIDPSSGAGGLLGKVDVTTLRPDVRRAIEGLRPGQISPIAQVATGFAVLQVVADEPGRPAAINPASFAAISAVGGVKFVPDIGGLPEAEALLREFPKADSWNQSPRSICQVRQDSLEAGQQLFETFFSPASTDVRKGRPPFEIMQAHLGLAQLLAYQGAMARAVEHYEQAYQLALSSVTPAVPQVEEMLGVAYLHKAAMESGIFRQPDDLCLLPVKAGRGYAKTADVEKAIARFAAFLERRPDDAEVRWLLNLAFMARGTWPDAVPEKFRIPPAAFASPEDVGRFRDVAPQTGLNVFASAGGVIVDDLTGSGRLDVVTSNFYSCGPMHYFGNNADGTWRERGPAAGLRDQIGGLNLVQADYDNDRCTDILVLRGGWEVPQRNSLLKNNCDGTFTDVTADAGLAVPATSTQAGTWADVNNDGWLDLFVGNEDTRAQLFLSDGKGHFTDIARAAGVDRNTFAKGVAAADYDNDGFVDFYVSNYDGVNQLYHNNGNNTFTERAAAAGVPGPGRGFGTWFVDIDNDGFLDLYLGMGTPSYAALAPHTLLRNSGGRRFVDVTESSGTGEIHKGHGIAFADLDNDGDEDIIAEIGGATPGDSHAMRIFENPGHGNDWLSLKLTGVKSNRSAIGARIVVTVENGGSRRTIHRQVVTGGSFGASPLEQHIGLGRDARLVDVEIWWPASNTRQHFATLDKNRAYGVEEMRPDAVPIDRTRIRLGGGKP